jgi:hypothetical protein
MMFAPLEGWRHVKVTDRHTAVDYAHVLKDLADAHFANAKVIVLVKDNLNIHSKAFLYEAFPAAPARRLVVERFGRVGRSISTPASRRKARWSRTRNRQGRSRNARQRRYAVDLFDRDLRLRQSAPPILRHTRPRHALGIFCPAFGQE